MTRYVAFLRAINVGKRQVKMDRLGWLFEELGYDDVATFISSGNVAFESRKRPATLEREIEAHLAGALGYEVETFVRSAEQLAVLAELDPFPDASRGADDRLHVTFLKKEPSAAAASAVAALSTDDDLLAIVGTELWHLRRGQLMDSTLPTGWEKQVDLGAGTSRNVNTIRRLAAKYPA